MAFACLMLPSLQHECRLLGRPHALAMTTMICMTVAPLALVNEMRKVC